MGIRDSVVLWMPLCSIQFMAHDKVLLVLMFGWLALQ